DVDLVDDDGEDALPSWLSSFDRKLSLDAPVVAIVVMAAPLFRLIATSFVPQTLRFALRRSCAIVVAPNRSPHGAERNAGTVAPDCASLHPGYDELRRLLVAQRLEQRAALVGGCKGTCRRGELDHLVQLLPGRAGAARRERMHLRGRVMLDQQHAEQHQ